MEDSLAVDLTRRDLERKASESYKGFVVRSRLKRVPNEAVKCGAFTRKEVRRFLHRYIDFVKSSDGHVLQSNREMHGAFRVHFRNRFARFPDLPVQEFRSYLTDFLCFEEAKAASCEGLVTEYEVRDVLKKVGLNKSPGLNGFPYEVYLRMSHMFVPILTDIFNQSQCRVLFAGCVKGKAVVVSRRSDIKAVKKAFKRYEEVAGAKINFDKNEGPRLGTWRGGVPLPGPVRILAVWFGPGSKLERNWSDVHAKVEAQVGTWLRRCLFLKGRVEVCAMYIFHLILYRLSVLTLPKVHRLALIQSFSKLLRRDRKLIVRKQVYYQRPRNGGLGRPDLKSHWLAERLAYLV